MWVLFIRTVHRYSFLVVLNFPFTRTAYILEAFNNLAQFIRVHPHPFHIVGWAIFFGPIILLLPGLLLLELWVLLGTYLSYFGHGFVPLHPQECDDGTLFLASAKFYYWYSLTLHCTYRFRWRSFLIPRLSYSTDTYHRITRVPLRTRWAMDSDSQQVDISTPRPTCFSCLCRHFELVFIPRVTLGVVVALQSALLLALKSKWWYFLDCRLGFASRFFLVSFAVLLLLHIAIAIVILCSTFNPTSSISYTGIIFVISWIHTCAHRFHHHHKRHHRYHTFDIKR